MKKNIVIIGVLTLIVVLGYWYIKHLPRARLSKGGEICHEKCRAILRENLKKCGEDCLTGAPFFAHDKVSGKCLSRVNLDNKKYYDYYVNDCKTNQYITRWNPTQEELAELPSIDGMAGETRINNSKLLNNLVDLASDKVEGGLFGP